MTPPEAPEDKTGTKPPAASLCLKGMKTRSEFLAAARACRQGTSSMLVQARDRMDDSSAIHVGFTCSKKLGNAVTRNRAKRRLREAARIVLSELARPGWDYVLIGKHGTTTDAPIGRLVSDLRYALGKLHGPG